MPKTMNSEVISAAIEGFQAQKRRIDEQIEELRSALSGAPSETAPLTKSGRPRRKMSASARKRIAAAQRKRWAEAKRKSAAESPAAKAPRAKRRLSAAGKKRIIDANRKRWAAVKAAGKSGSKRGARKKAAPAPANE
jgi:cell division septum initiation protein DivIVA